MSVMLLSTNDYINSLFTQSTCSCNRTNTCI